MLSKEVHPIDRRCFALLTRRQEIYKSKGRTVLLCISERGQLGSQGTTWEKREKGREKGHLEAGLRQHSEKGVLGKMFKWYCCVVCYRLYVVHLLFHVPYGIFSKLTIFTN